MIRKEFEQLVYGEVYVPFRLDTDGEFMRPEEIEKAAHYFMEHSKPSNVDQQHDFKTSTDTVVETYIAKAGDPEFPEGTWVAVTQINDPQRWQKVLSGELNGYSMAGHATKTVHKQVQITALKQIKGQTEESTHNAFDPHRHDFVIRFDDKGNVVPTKTSEAAGHTHDILMTTATMPNQGHAHRFNINWSADDENVTKESRVIEATELTDVQPKFISLVAHGAARRAFTVVKMEKAQWTTQYINDLPDSAFAVIETGAGENKSARHLPYKDAEGQVDLPHLENALARYNQIKSVLGNDDDSELRARAKKVLMAVAAKHLPSHQEETQKMDRVVHAIILEGIELDEAAVMPEMEWMGSSAIKVQERVRIGKQQKCVLKPASEFARGTLEIQKTSDERVRLLVGVLKNENMDNAVIITEEKKMDENQVLTLVEKAVGEKTNAILAAMEELKKSLEKPATAEKTAEVAPPSVEKAPAETPAEENAEDKKLSEIASTLSALAKEISSMKEEAAATAKKTEELVSKTEALASSATTLPGVKAAEDVVKADGAQAEKSPWGGIFTNYNNPKIAAILNS